MDKQRYAITLKLVSIALIIYLVFNLYFYLVGIVRGMVFWITLLAIALINAKLLPYLRKRAGID